MKNATSLWLALGGMLAMAAGLGIGRFVYTPILPEMAAALGWSGSAAGAAASANFLGYLAGALLAARGGVARAPRPWLLLALIASGATTMAMAAGADPVAASVIRLIGGLASAFVIVCASTLVLERLAAAGRGGLAALHFAGVGLGIALSSLLVAGLLATGLGWRALWLASGALALAATPFAALWIPRAAAIDPAFAPPQRAAGAGGALWLLVLAYGLFGFGYVVTATFLVAIVRETPAVAPLEPWIWLVVGLASMPSVALWSRAAGRLGALKAYALAAALLALGVAASVEARTPLGVGLSALLLGGTFMGMTALGLIAARGAAGGRAQRAIALMTASFAVGQAAGPALAGVMIDRLGGYRAPSLLAAAALLLAALLAVLAARRRAAAATG